MKFLLIIFLSFISQFILSQETEKDVKFDIELNFNFDRQYKKTLKRNLQKDLYDILITTEKFNFIISSEKKQYQNIRFDGDFKINKKNGLSIIEMALIDPKGKIINKVKDEYVLKKKVLFRSRDLFLELFAGDYKEKKENKKKDVAMLLPEVKKAFVQQAIKKKKIKVPIKEKSPSEKETKLPPTEEKEEKKEEETIEEEKKKPKKKKKKKRVSDISNFDNSPVLDLTKEYPKNPKSVGLASRWLKDFTFMVGQGVEVIRTDSITSLETTTKRFNFVLDGNYGKEKSLGFINFRGSLGLISGETDYGFGPIFELGAGYYFAPFGKIIAFGGGLLINAFNFAGITRRGAGLRKASHTGLWFGGGVKVNFDEWIKGLSFSGNIYNSYITTATIAEELEIPTNGKLLQVIGKIGLFWGVGVGVKYDSVLTSSAGSDVFSVDYESLTILLTI